MRSYDLHPVFWFSRDIVGLSVHGRSPLFDSQRVSHERTFFQNLKPIDRVS